MTPSEAIRRQVRARLAAQRALVASLLALREQLQGSLFTRYGECGKANCACRRGLRHGPYYVLSTRSAGHGGFAYLEGAKVGEAQDLVKRYRLFRSGLKRLHRLNTEIVDLLRRYQRGAARKAGRRLGISI